MSTSLEAARQLRVDIECIEAQYGPNAYADYLRKHGKRPPRDEAATIGKLLGGRVMADDGSMQPRPTAAERKALKARRDEFRAMFDLADGLRAMIVPAFSLYPTAANSNKPKSGG